MPSDFQGRIVQTAFKTCQLPGGARQVIGGSLTGMRGVSGWGHVAAITAQHSSRHYENKRSTQ
jgi:hypothetical protein